MGLLYLVGPPRFELGTSAMSRQRSNQLSYDPILYICYYAFSFKALETGSEGGYFTQSVGQRQAWGSHLLPAVAHLAHVIYYQ
jgi:hypothetical protein